MQDDQHKNEELANDRAEDTNHAVSLEQVHLKYFGFDRKEIFIACLLLLMFIGGLAYVLFAENKKSANTQIKEVDSTAEQASDEKISDKNADEKNTVSNDEDGTVDSKVDNASSKTSETGDTTSQPTVTSVVKSIEKALSSYSLDIQHNTKVDSCTYATWNSLNSGDLATLQEFEDDFVGEISDFPADLITNSGVTKIGLVKNLKVSGQARAAAPAPCINAMLYDVKAMVGAGDAYSRQVISHEFWHYADYAIMGDYYYNDAQWVACNPAGFTYGTGGEAAYEEADFYNSFHPQKSFITNYARYGQEEDRAEIFSWIMYNPSKIAALKKSDSGIKCKVERLEELAHSLSPGVNW
jgi:hypothetical protein